jgi:hypothetical protein
VVQCEGKEILEKLEHMLTFIKKKLTEQLSFHYYKTSAMTNILTGPPSSTMNARPVLWNIP